MITDNLELEEKYVIDRHMMDWQTLTGILGKQTSPGQLFEQFYTGYDAFNTPAVYYKGTSTLLNKNGAPMQLFIEVGKGVDSDVWEVTTLIASNAEGSINTFKCSIVHELSMKYFKKYTDATTLARHLINAKMEWL